MRRLNAADAASLGETDEPAGDFLSFRKSDIYRRLRAAARP